MIANETELDLPPLNAARKDVYDFYKISFLADAYPGKRLDDGSVVPHPIYGTYVINDYIAQYRKTGDDEFLRAARRVAGSAISRMTPLGAALVFMYTGESAVSSLTEEFYSALTQARYLDVLSRLSLLDETTDYSSRLEGLIASLALPVAEGGVARTTPGGNIALEEYAHSLPDYTLNGWLTATNLLGRYASRSKSEQALDLFASSVRGIRELLPLYDLPELNNSRYRLGGRLHVDLEFSHAGIKIPEISVEIPNGGNFRFTEVRGLHNNHIISGWKESGCRQSVRVLGQFSVISHPAKNRLRMKLLSDRDGTLDAFALIGKYNPLRVFQASDGVKKPIAENVVIHKGWNEVVLSMPNELVEGAAYPTSFTKKIGGKNYNQYHFIHIHALRSIVELDPTAVELAEYADKWEQYVRKWKGDPAYQEQDIELTQFGK